MNTLRIGILIERWQPERGGAARSLAELAARLLARGHDVHVFCEQGPRSGLGAPGTWHRVSVGPFRREPREVVLGRALVDAARQAECDVTLAATPVPNVDLYWASTGTLKATIDARTRAQQSAREKEETERGTLVPFGRPDGRKNRWRGLLEMEYGLLEGGKAHRVMCPSKRVREEIEEAFPACSGRVVELSPGVDLGAFSPKIRERERQALRLASDVTGTEPLIAFSSPDPVIDGLPLLLRALSGLQDRPWSFVAAVGGEASTWSRRARREGISRDRLRFVRELEPWRRAAGADLWVSPTWRRTMDSETLEALAAGTPVITTENSAAAEAVTDESGSVLPASRGAASLRVALGHWIERAATARVNPETVRASVEGRDRDAWLVQFESILVDVARRGRPHLMR